MDIEIGGLDRLKASLTGNQLRARKSYPPYAQLCTYEYAACCIWIEDRGSKTDGIKSRHIGLFKELIHYSIAHAICHSLLDSMQYDYKK
jgi:hypothetical protein